MLTTSHIAEQHQTQQHITSEAERSTHSTHSGYANHKTHRVYHLHLGVGNHMELRVREDQECDFEGRAALDPEQLEASPLAACFNSGSLDQHLVYTGLSKGVGAHLPFLAANVHFSARSGQKLERAAGPMQVGEDGRVYAAVQYPSMSELWPDIYRTKAVRVVQVDVYVEVRSDRETIRYPGTEFKVTYRRERAPSDDLVTWRP